MRFTLPETSYTNFDKRLPGWDPGCGLSKDSTLTQGKNKPHIAEGKNTHRYEVAKDGPQVIKHFIQSLMLLIGLHIHHIDPGSIFHFVLVDFV